MTRTYHALMFGSLIMLAAGMYCLPWVTNPTASLMLNGFELAEWSSLHPAIRATQPPLLATLSLRSPLLWISIITALLPSVPRWIRIGATTALAAVLLPPPAFFTSEFTDPNYRQMFLLSVAVAGTGLSGIMFDGKRWPIVVQVAAVGMMIASSIFGLTMGYTLMQEFNLPVAPGPGGLGLIIVSIVIGAGLIIKRGNFA